MKNLLFLSFLLFSLCGFGQSAKKQNVKLRADLERCKEEYELSKEKYQAAQLDLAGGYFSPLMQKMQEMAKSMYQNELIRKETFRENESLKLLLGQITSKTVDTTVVIPFEDRLKRINSEIAEAFKDDKDPTEVYDTLALDYYKLSLENELIIKQIQLYVFSKLEYDRFSNQLETYKPVATRAIASLDSVNTDVLALRPVLQEKQDAVQSQLDSLEANYKKKGPAGFPEAYAKEFPYAFEPKAELRDAPYTEKAMRQRENPKLEFAEPVKEQIEPQKEPMILNVVEEQAEFPGGRAALLDYLKKSIVLPSVITEMGLSGKVYLQFVVSEDGSISDIKVKRGIDNCEECSEEAIRVVQAMPKWIPARNNGVVVKSYYTLPIVFKAE
jgi:TonB family protein